MKYFNNQYISVDTFYQSGHWLCMRKVFTIYVFIIFIFYLRYRLFTLIFQMLRLIKIFHILGTLVYYMILFLRTI